MSSRPNQGFRVDPIPASLDTRINWAKDVKKFERKLNPMLDSEEDGLAKEPFIKFSNEKGDATDDYARIQNTASLDTPEGL